jgi:hypothetical protein
MYSGCGSILLGVGCISHPRGNNRERAVNVYTCHKFRYFAALSTGRTNLHSDLRLCSCFAFFVAPKQ